MSSLLEYDLQHDSFFFHSFFDFELKDGGRASLTTTTTTAAADVSDSASATTITNSYEEEESITEPELDPNDDTDNSEFGVNFFINMTLEDKAPPCRDINKIEGLLATLVDILKGKIELKEDTIPQLLKLTCKYLYYSSNFTENRQHAFTVSLLSALVAKVVSKTFVKSVLKSNSQCFASVKYTLCVIQRYCITVLQQPRGDLLANEEQFIVMEKTLCLLSQIHNLKMLSDLEVKHLASQIPVIPQFSFQFTVNDTEEEAPNRKNSSIVDLLLPERTKPTIYGTQVFDDKPIDSMRVFVRSYMHMTLSAVNHVLDTIFDIFNLALSSVDHTSSQKPQLLRNSMLLVTRGLQFIAHSRIQISIGSIPLLIEKILQLYFALLDGESGAVGHNPNQQFVTDIISIIFNCGLDKKDHDVSLCCYIARAILSHNCLERIDSETLRVLLLVVQSVLTNDFTLITKRMTSVITEQHYFAIKSDTLEKLYPVGPISFQQPQNTPHESLIKVSDFINCVLNTDGRNSKTIFAMIWDLLDSSLSRDTELAAINYCLDFLILTASSSLETVRSAARKVAIEQVDRLITIGSMIEGRKNAQNYREWKEKYDYLRNIYVEFCYEADNRAILDMLINDESLKVLTNKDRQFFCFAARLLIVQIKRCKDSTTIIEQLWSAFFKTLPLCAGVHVDLVSILLFSAFHLPLETREQLACRMIDLITSRITRKNLVQAQIIVLTQFFLTHLEKMPPSFSTDFNNNLLLEQTQSWQRVAIYESLESSVSYNFNAEGILSERARVLLQDQRACDLKTSLLNIAADANSDSDRGYLGTAAINLYLALLRGSLDTTHTVPSQSTYVCIDMALSILNEDTIDDTTLEKFMEYSCSLSQINYLVCDSVCKALLRVMNEENHGSRSIVMMKPRMLILLEKFFTWILQSWKQVLVEELRSDTALSAGVVDIAVMIASAGAPSSCLSKLLGDRRLTTLHVDDWIEEKRKCFDVQVLDKVNDSLSALLVTHIVRTTCMSEIEHITYASKQSLATTLSLLSLLKDGHSYSSALIMDLISIESNNIFGLRGDSKAILDEALDSNVHQQKLTFAKLSSTQEVIMKLSNQYSINSSLVDTWDSCMSSLFDYMLEQIEQQKQLITEYFDSEAKQQQIQCYIELLTTNKNSGLKERIITFLNHIVTSASSARALVLNCVEKDISKLFDEMRAYPELHPHFQNLFESLIACNGTDLRHTQCLDHIFELMLNHFDIMVRENNSQIVGYFRSLSDIAVSRHCEQSFGKFLLDQVQQQTKLKDRNLEFIYLIISTLFNSITISMEEQKLQEIKQCLEDLSVAHGHSSSILSEVHCSTGILSVDDNIDQELPYESLNPQFIPFNSNSASHSFTESVELSLKGKESLDMFFNSLVKSKSLIKLEFDSSMQIEFLSKLIILLETLLEEMTQSGKMETANSTAHNWSLSTIERITYSGNSMAKLSSSYPASTFRSEVVPVGRQERSVVSKNSLQFQLCACNSEDFFIIAEESTMNVTSRSNVWGILAPESVERSNIKLLSEPTVPFKITRVLFNPENDHFVAVAGIFETHVFVLNDAGEPIQQIQLYLGLEDMPNETFITNIQWLPGSQVLLAVITNRFVKVYDLSSDTFCPVFNFAPHDDSLIVSGSFGLIETGQIVLFVLTQGGTLYYQEYLDSGGPCYFTESIDITHLAGSSTSKQGASIFYSSLMGLLIVCFAAGNTFMCKVNITTGRITESQIIYTTDPLDMLSEEVQSKLSNLAPFNQWIEISDLPGVFACVAKNHSVVLFQLTNNEIRFEEITNSSPVHGLQGLQALSSRLNSSICVLTKDGGMRHYALSSTLASTKPFLVKSRSTRQGSFVRSEEKDLLIVGSPVPRPAVFLNQTEISHNIKFGCEGYPDSEITSTLTTESGHLQSPSASGFTLTLENLDPSATVVCRIQVLVGAHLTHSIPKSITINGVSCQTQPNIRQWIDINIPILNCTTDTLIGISVSEAHDPSTSPIIDQVRVFAVSSSICQFEQQRIKSRNSSSPITFPPQSVSNTQIVKHILQVVSKYFVALPEASATFALLDKIVEMIFTRYHLSAFHLSAIAALLPTTSYSASCLRQVVNKVILKYVDSVNIDDLNGQDLEYVFRHTNSLLISSPYEFNELVRTYKTLPEKLFNKFKVLKVDNSIPINVMVSSVTGVIVMAINSLISERCKDEDCVQMLNKLLLDDDEVVRMEASKSLIYMLRSCPLLSENKTQFDHLLLHLFHNLINQHSTFKEHASLTVLNYYHSIIHIIGIYVSQHGNEEDIESIVKAITGIIESDDQIFSLSKRSDANEIRLATLLFTCSTLGISDTHSDSLQRRVGKFVESMTHSLQRKDISKQLLHLVESIAPEIERDQNNMLFADIMGGLLTPQRDIPDRNFSPLMSSYYCEDHKLDLFQPYYKIVLQMTFQLIYVLYKNNTSESVTWDAEALSRWNTILSSLALNQNSEYLKQRAKDLLIKINGGIEVYNVLTDVSLFDLELLDFRKPIGSFLNYSSDKALDLVTNLDRVIEKATQRPGNWSDYCAKNELIYSSLALFSLHFSNETCVTPLKLLNLSLNTTKDDILPNAIEQILGHSELNMSRFIDQHVLASNTLTVRTEACTLLTKLLSPSDPYCTSQTKLIELILSKIPLLPSHGRKSNEFATILIPHISQSCEIHERVVNLLLDTLKYQTDLISKHSNLYIYNALRKLIKLDGYYLEVNPCLVCNNPEVPYSERSFSSIKKQVKYEHSSTYLQFDASYTINQINFEASYRQKEKTIRSIELYYNNQQGLTPGELKENTTIWKKIGTIMVARDATSAFINLSIPITASNILAEYSSFYEDLLASNQLVCPSCNIPVLDKHGLCSACSENAYQCSKCRHINYSELDCYQCSTCGHSRYGTFSLSFSAKQSFSIDRIRDEKDSKKAMVTIESQLQIANEKYHLLKQHKDTIYQKLKELENGVRVEDGDVNACAEEVIQLYTSDVTETYEEMSLSTNTIAMTRKELTNFLRRRPIRKVDVDEVSETNVKPITHHNNCFGCAISFVTICLGILTKVGNMSKHIGRLLDNVRFGSPETILIARQVLCSLTKDDLQAMQALCSTIQTRIEFALQNSENLNLSLSIGNYMHLLSNLDDVSASCFESYFTTIRSILHNGVRHGVNNIEVCEEIIIPCLKMLQKLWSVESESHEKHFAVNTSSINNLLLNSCFKEVRVQTKDLLHLICKTNPERELEVLKVLCASLPYAMRAGEDAKEFFEMFTTLIEPEERKYFLSTGGFLTIFCENLLEEANRVEDAEIFEGALANLTQGFTLMHLVQILDNLLQVQEILEDFKAKENHIASVLRSFLSLRSIIVQGTAMTTECCKILRNLMDKLQETDRDKELFLNACIDALRTRTDNLSAVFIFERMCNMIVPLKEPRSCQLTLNKHAAQEYFFQGNMRGNPYDSRQIGLTMSDVANRILKEMDICSDFALELLVKNKIINLNLPISQVYDQVWKDSIEDDSPMEVIFRFQGVDGEATEDIIDTLEEDGDDQNLEEKCKITSSISRRGGLDLVLEYLTATSDISSDRHLVKYILQLLLYCTVVKRNRRKLLMLNAIEILLDKCKLVFSHGELTELAELILLVIKPIVEEATMISFEMSTSPLTPLSPYGSGDDNSALLGVSHFKANSQETLKQMKMFLERLPTMSSKIVDAVSKILPFLTYGEKESSQYLVEYFEPYLDLEQYDINPSKDNTFYLATFAKVISAIPNNVAGSNLKAFILDKGITGRIFDHLVKLFDPTGDNSSPQWQESYAKPSVYYALSLLNGLCTLHAASQNLLLSQDLVIKLLHKMEENVQAKEVATLSESLLNRLSENGFEASADVNSIRSKTKKRKERKAKNTRDKVLKNFGWNMTQGGEIKQEKATPLNLDELVEESGLTCCICGDGYTFKPNELLGIYTYGKVTSFGDFTGFSSVTSFTVIHIDCHRKAARADSKLRPPKSVWEGALIRNGFSQCNSLFPIFGPENDVKSYCSGTEHHWKHMSALRSIGDRFKTLALDLMSLLQKLAKMESLSIDSGGGSVPHNMKLVIFEVQMGSFILDETNERAKYEDILNDFLAVENVGFGTVSNSSAFYNCVLSLFLMNKEEWDANKTNMLIKLISQHKNDRMNMGELDTNPFELCRTPLIFFCLVDQFQNCLKTSSNSDETSNQSQTTKKIHHEKDANWITSLNTRIRIDHMSLLNSVQEVAESFYPKLKKVTDVNQFLSLVVPSVGINGSDIEKHLEHQQQQEQE